MKMDAIMPGILMRLPIIVMFINGYIIYRLLSVTGLAELFVIKSLSYRKFGPKALIFIIILVTALLSFFIPNTITVLTMLPVLKTIREKFDFKIDGRAKITTILTLSVIYGANIGGMGSLIGSPANLLLIGELDIYKVSGRYEINFFNWFLWSLPLVTVMIFFAWLILVSGVSFSYSQSTNTKSYNFSPVSKRQKSGAFLFVFFLIFWILMPLIMKSFNPGFFFESAASIIFFLIFCFLIFLKLTDGKPLLHPKDLIQGMPARGFLFLGFLFFFVFIIKITGLDNKASEIFVNFLPSNKNHAVFVLTIVASVIFFTEIISNTAVSTGFFPIAYWAAIKNNIPPLVLMTGVSLASTCAFMTPIATPCNALAFGEMKGTSLKKMLVSGFILNIIGAILISFWLEFIIPEVYG